MRGAETHECEKLMTDKVLRKSEEKRVCVCVYSMCFHSNSYEIESFGFLDRLISPVPLIIITVCPKGSQFTEKRCANSKANGFILIPQRMSR